MGTVLAILTMRESKTLYKNQYSLALPELMHRSVETDELAKKRVLIFGDVHGCYDELVDLLELVNAAPDTTLIVSCGDLINRGPKSVEVLRLIRRWGSSALCVRGNHEERVIKEWQIRNNSFHDKTECASNKYNWVTILEEDDILFLQDLPYTISIPSLNTTVVHAGLDPWKSLIQQQPMNMTLMRNILNPESENHIIAEACNEGVPWASCWMGPSHVCFGHDARRRLQRYKFATGLDTGCVYGGQLTGMLIDSSSGEINSELVSVNAKQIYKQKIHSAS